MATLSPLYLKRIMSLQQKHLKIRTIMSLWNQLFSLNSALSPTQKSPINWLLLVLCAHILLKTMINV